MRYVLPLTVIAAGVLAMALTGPDDERYVGGAAIIGAGAAIWLINLLLRLSISGDRERDREEEARAYFDEHGRWPDDPPG